MKFIYATYNQYCNSIDITTFDNMLLRIDCNEAEDGLKTTPNSQLLFTDHLLPELNRGIRLSRNFPFCGASALPKTPLAFLLPVALT